MTKEASIQFVSEPRMSIERMTITMPADMAAIVKAAVETGDYASTSEVVRDDPARI